MENNTNMDNIQRALKKIVLSLGLFLFLGIGLFVYLYINKKNNGNNTSSSVINNKVSMENCKINNVIYKDNYIVLESLDCNRIKIISIPNLMEKDISLK